MLKKNIRHIPVVDQDRRLVGLLTHRDIVRRAMYPDDEVTPSEQKYLLRLMRVQEVMTNQVQTIGSNDRIVKAAAIMLEKKFGCLPVIDNNEIVGILTESDFVRHILATESTLPGAQKNTASLDGKSPEQSKAGAPI